MDATTLLPMAVVATVVAMIVTAYELSASLEPATCAECPHCAQRAAERQRRDDELSAWYAHEQRLDRDEPDDRRRR
jgi:hypothetical protein